MAEISAQALLMANKKGVLKFRTPGCKYNKILLRAQNRVFGGLGYAEFNDALGWDLDGFASLGVAAHASGAVAQNELADARQCEGVLRVLVSERGNVFKDFPGFFLGNFCFFSDCGGQL
jgi:hypothetical protein